MENHDKAKSIFIKRLYFILMFAALLVVTMLSVKIVMLNEQVAAMEASAAEAKKVKVVKPASPARMSSDVRLSEKYRNALAYNRVMEDLEGEIRKDPHSKALRRLKERAEVREAYGCELASEFPCMRFRQPNGVVKHTVVESLAPGVYTTPKELLDSLNQKMMK